MFRLACQVSSLYELCYQIQLTIVDDTVHTSDVKYKFFMKRLLHRYKDIAAGYTNVDDDGCITDKFSTHTVNMSVSNRIRSNPEL